MFPFIVSCFNLSPRYIYGGAIFPFLYLTFFSSITFIISVKFIYMANIFSTYNSTYVYYSYPSGLAACVNLTYGSAGLDLNHILSSFFDIKGLKSTLAYFNIYRALITINMFSCSSPNLGPYLIQFFLILLADKKTLCTSAPNIRGLLKQQPIEGLLLSPSVLLFCK